MWAPQYLTPLSQTISLSNDDMESSLEYDHLSDLVYPGHVFAVIAPQGNEEIRILVGTMCTGKIEGNTTSDR